MRNLPLALAFLAAPGLAQGPADGFVVFSPSSSNDTYLLDDGGNAVHTWSSSFVPGIGVYMRGNGNLVRAIRTTGTIGGSGGGVQELAWDGTLLWDFRYDSGGVLQHHDLALMPNGNVLMFAWENKTKSQAVQEGRDPTTVPGNIFRPEHIVEVRPTGPTTGEIVWKWHIWDHMVQDFDPSKANFGVVGDHPELIDINFPPGIVGGQGDWVHANAIDYDPVNDQILLSASRFHEVWVIDHSTTTAEAAGHTGGAQGKGGDLLYRFGNPAAYGAGTAANQLFFHQHGANWIDAGLPGEGNIVLFNNGVGMPGPDYSTVLEFTPPIDASGGYPLASGAAWGPTLPTWSYNTPIPGDLFSSILSSAQRLSNGNTLVCSGNQGWIFELDSDGQKVWEYQHPVPSEQMIFMARRYERTLWSHPQELSAVAGGKVDFALEASAEQAGRVYILLGSASGTSPGITVDGHLLPLNVFDPYFQITLAAPNTPPLTDTFGNLSGAGSATAAFTVPAGVIPVGLAGTEVNHAYAVIDLATAQVSWTSNAAGFTVVP